MKLLPRWFYRAEQRELVQLYDDLARAALREKGATALIGLTLRAVGDLLAEAVVLRTAGHDSPERLGRSQTAKARRGDGMLERTWREFRHGLKSLCRRPLVSLTATTTLAIGIGTSVALFSVIYGVLLRPTGLESTDQLVNIRQHHRTNPNDSSGMSSGLFHLLREELSETQAFTGWLYDSITLQPGGAYVGEAVELDGAVVVAEDFFDVLGVSAVRGRLFEPGDAPPGSGRGSAAVVSDQFFDRVFGGDQRVLGKTLTLDGQQVQIVGVASGVLPAPISGLDVWLCDGFRSDDRSLSRRILPIARLAEGSSAARLTDQLSRAYSSLTETYPALEEWSARATPLRDDLIGGVSYPLWIAFAGVLLLLVLACANFVNLLLAQLTVRRQELATRASLGAGRMALVAQQLVEGLLMACAAGLLGVCVAWALRRYLVQLADGLLPRLGAVQLDLPVLGFALVLSVLVGLACSVVPSLLAARFSSARRVGSSGARGGDAGGHRLRAVLAAAQISVALVLLAGGALLGRSFHLLTQSNPGFALEELAVARIYLDDDRYATLEQEQQYFTRLVEQVEAIPGVVAAATTTSLPMDPDTVDYDLPYRRADQPAAQDLDQAFYRVASPGYIETMGIQLLRGRGLEARDLTGNPVVVINQALAQRVWPDGDALGGQLVVPGAGRGAFEVVGVVADTSFSSLGAAAKPEMYFPRQLYSLGGRSLVARVATDDMTAVVAGLRAAALTVDPLQPVSLASTLARLSSATIAAQRFQARLALVTGALAMLLAVSGIYSTIAFWVGQTRFELGLRIAVGASRTSIVGLVVSRGLRVVALGLGVGLALAVVTLRAIGSLLHAVSWFDPLVLFGVSCALVVLTVSASMVPARAAARLDPCRILRAD